MSSKSIMEFKRGAGVGYTVQIPIADYVAGSTLFFTAKPAIDNDATDAAAVINKGFTDSVVSLSATYATYTLNFHPSDITTILFTGGASELDYFGEFKYVTPGADPVIWPGNNQYIQVKIYADVKLATS